MNVRQIRQSFILLLTAVIWGVAFVAQSVGMDYVGPFTFICVRSLIGGLVLLPCITLLDRLNGRREGTVSENDGGNKGNTDGNNGTGWKGNRNDKNSRAGERQSVQKSADMKTLLLGGVCCGLALCAASCFQQFGILYTSVGKAGFLTAFYIIIVPVLGLFFGKKCGPFVWIGVLLALAGLYFLCMTESLRLGTGDILVFICACLFSVHILVIDYFTRYVDGVKMSCIQFFVCGAVSGIAMLIFERPELTQLLAAWKPVLYAGVLSSGAGYTLQIVGQKDMNPTVASLILSLESVVSVLAGMLFLNQHLTSRELFGCILMFSAIILAQLPQKEKKESLVRVG